MAEQGSRKRSVATKPPPVEPPRHYAPRGIAALLAPVVRPALHRRGMALATLVEDWSTIAGPDIASRSLPVKFAAGTLTLACTGPDALELQHRTPDLIARINLALGGGTIVRLRFIDMPRPPAERTKSRRTAITTEPPPLTGPDALPDGPIGEALARLRLGLHRQGRTTGR
ncbi:hypothetical protein SAMN05421828_10548 [Acidiphilium rubrum]|uniref:DUF721 domain-containing protein n=1 Tax=Acidiphilium rubrum TaxID=526 RepID=A0A8G2CJ94_ACIRU|nr:hypothetical protein SAMN05421828_10548 [Acidiphilium rubrum]